MKILKYPENENILRKPSVDLSNDDIATKETANLIDEMIKCLKKTNGLGLAAPQIGVNKRLFIFQSRQGDVVEIINPIFLAKTGRQRSYGERCLSFSPEIAVNIRRHSMIKIKYLDMHGKEHIHKSVGHESIVLQHEIDHLNGKLIIDYVPKG